MGIKEKHEQECASVRLLEEWGIEEALKKVEEMPNILQSCVALGNKVIFERKVRVALEVSPSFILTVFTCQ